VSLKQAERMTNSARLRRQEGVVMLEDLFQPTHLLVIFVIALLVFGPKKLPELGKGIGEGIRGFRSSLKEPVNTADEESADQKILEAKREV
jgi:sec-independent protein translocase protein TatA